MPYPGYNEEMKIGLLSLIGSLMLTGCTFGYGGWSVQSLPSAGEDTAPPDEEFMYLDLDEDYYGSLGVEPPLYEINTTEEYGDSQRRESVSNCEILYDEEEPASPELICILDYMEEEFLLYDLSFYLNVPKGMCHSLKTTPAWHYDREMGIGPGVIVHSKVPEEPEEGEEQTDRYCLVESTDRCVEDSNDIEKLCPYVHVRNRGKVNCCLGTYRIIGETTEESTPWGGDARQCIGGPGRTSWDLYDDNTGFPIHLAEYVLEDGLRRTFNIRNLIDVALGGGLSTPIANYMKVLDKPAEDIQSDSISLPEFLRSPEEGILPSGSPFYTFTCSDPAGDILQRIRLLIREWNTYEEFMDHYESGGSDESADPDVEGIEGDDCPYEDRRLFNNRTGWSECNDYLDLDDILDRGSDAYPEANYQN